MKKHLIAAILTTIIPVLPAQEETTDPDRAANTVILDETAIKNLNLETVTVEEQDFETTVFAIGRIEEIPSNHYSVTSRISGRAIEVNVFEGDHVKAGQTLIKVESRQPGDPPPTIPLKAPHDGLVIESRVHAGQPVEPDTQLLDISDRSEMWAVASIPEQQAAGIAPGTRARISVPAIGGKPIEAELLRLGVTADRVAGTVEGIFQIPNPGERLQPGMRAEFSIVLGTRSEVLAVPRASIQGDPSKRVVYVKDFEIPNAFVRVPVVLGEKNEEYVEVVGGLFAGDDVVTRGSYSLGFVGAGGGMSLKEALDAAHGHEHNEDGSKLTPEQQAAADTSSGGDANDHDEGGKLTTILLGYSAAVTMLALVLAQLLWNKRKATA